jgi:hypothetical protein
VPPIVTPWFEDKAVKMVLTFLCTILANAVLRKYGIGLNVEEITGLAFTIVAFIAGHKWKTAKLQAAAMAAGQAAQAAPGPGPLGVGR